MIQFTPLLVLFFSTFNFGMLVFFLWQVHKKNKQVQPARPLQRIAEQKKIHPQQAFDAASKPTPQDLRMQMVPVCHECMHRIGAPHPEELEDYPEPCQMCFENKGSNGTISWVGVQGLIHSYEGAETKFAEEQNRVVIQPGLDRLLAPVAHAILSIREPH